VTRAQQIAELLSAQRERDQLRVVNSKLRDKLLELAKECSGCNGTGVHTVRGFERRGQALERQEPCRDCADIRAVLE
jgi:hypothetical protein